MAIVPLHNCLSVILFYAVFCFGSTAEWTATAGISDMGRVPEALRT
nr:cadherin-related neuronal receptor variable 9 short nonsplicing form 2 [Danio rerio]